MGIYPTIHCVNHFYSPIYWGTVSFVHYLIYEWHSGSKIVICTS
jgi:hypothetical protein